MRFGPKRWKVCPYAGTLPEHCRGAFEQGTEPRNEEMGPRDEAPTPSAKREKTILIYVSTMTVPECIMGNRFLSLDWDQRV